MATQIEPTTQEPRSTTGRSLTATRPLMGWRTVDILTIAFLGAALGVAFWGWGVFYNGPVTALKIGYAPLMGLFVGPWFLAGVVGGLVVRRPGDQARAEHAQGAVESVILGGMRRPPQHVGCYERRCAVSHGLSLSCAG